MIAAATEKGLKITEVPISAIYTKDSSTLNPISHGVGVLTRIVAMISQRRPLLFFGIPGVVLVAAGIYLGIWVLDVAYAGGGVPAGRAMISVLLVLAGVFSTFTGIILNAISQLRD